MGSKIPRQAVMFLNKFDNTHHLFENNRLFYSFSTF